MLKNFIIKKLKKKKKIKIYLGHSVNNLKDIDILVHSSAIKNNIELQYAKKKKYLSTQEP